jgi:hypothetical protein
VESSAGVQSGPSADTNALRVERVYDYGDDRSFGWMMFAATMLGLVAVLNIIDGIAAIRNSHFYVGNAHYVVGNLNAWGWTVLIIGITQGLTAVGIVFRNQIARWAGVVLAAANAIAQLMFIPAYPFWSLTLFALDILVIYGLVAYGRRSSQSAE